MLLHIKEFLFIIILSSFIAGCAVMKTGKSDRQMNMKYSGEGFTIKYLLYLPPDYNEEKEYPLVLFLHGSGERGRSLSKVKTHGPPKLVHEGKDFPFILVSPQCPDGERWDVPKLSDLLNEVQDIYNADKNRIYVTGLSMGGYGAWKLAQTYPDRFAAIIPVCGGGDFSNACIIKHVPVWVFHGAKDKVVSLQESQRMVDALKKCDGNVRFTVYPDAGHDSWTETYKNHEIYSWLLNQSLNQKSQQPHGLK